MAAQSIAYGGRVGARDCGAVRRQILFVWSHRVGAQMRYKIAVAEWAQEKRERWYVDAKRVGPPGGILAKAPPPPA